METRDCLYRNHIRELIDSENNQLLTIQYRHKNKNYKTDW